MVSKPRVVIDPNLLASVLLGGRVRDHFVNLVSLADNIDICYADELLAEVIALPRHRYFQEKGITDKIVAEFVTFLTGFSLKVFITSEVKIGRDQNDFYLLSLCRDARADFLLTGDPDLLMLGRYSQTQILRFPEFMTMLSNLS